MRRPLIAGNWKMHGSRVSTRALLCDIVRGCEDVSQVDLVVFPPYVYLEQVQEQLAPTAVCWGGQNVSAKTESAYTGEISAAMLLDFACRYVLIGHSERRSLYCETDAIVAAKFMAAGRAGLIPVLCVGETLAEREAGQTEAVIERQLAAVLQQQGKPIQLFANALIAYEPVWAIGTGLTASPEQAQAVHRFVRGFLKKYDENIAQALRILYGGSVKVSNAGALLQMPDIDGGLVGGASLNAQDFLGIARSCSY